MQNDFINQIKPGEKNQKIYAGNGIFLQISPGNTKRWRFKYRYQGKEKLLSMGLYPEVDYKKAYKTSQEFKDLLKQGIDPSFERKKRKLIDNSAKGEKMDESEKFIGKKRMSESLFIRFVAEYYEDHDWFKKEINYYEPNFELMKKAAKDAADEFFK